MVKNNRWFTLAVVLVLSLTPLVRAENAAPTPAPNPAPPRVESAEALVDVLQLFQAKGMLTDQEFQVMKQRVLAVKQQQEPAAPQEKAKNIVTAMDSGVGIKVGDVNVRFSGEFNAFYVHDRTDRTNAPGVLTLASTGAVPNSSIRNGLLPGNFTINLSTVQRGMDIGVTFGF